VPAYFLELALRAGLIAVGTSCVLRVLRVRHAADRHAAWTVALLCLLLLPIYTAAGPTVPLAVVPEGAMPPGLASDTGVAGSAAAGPPLARLALPADTAPRSGRGPSPGDWLVIAVYFLGAGALLARLATGTVRARQLYRSARMCNGRLTSARCATPITVGWLAPVLILPEGWDQWSAGRLDAVLTHEHEHVRRHDPLIQWLALLNRALLWFHPLAWWLAWRLSTLAEEACDSAVLRRGHAPQDYSGYLIDMAHAVSRQGRRLTVAGMTMPGSGLPARIRCILEERTMAPRSRTHALCTLAFCAASSIICLAVTLTPRQSAVPHSAATEERHAAAGTLAVGIGSIPAETGAAKGTEPTRTRPRQDRSRRVQNEPALATQPDFSGDWVLVGSTFTGRGRGGGDGRPVSIISGAPVNCGPACTIVQNTGSLTILRTSTPQDAASPDDGTVVLNLEGGESTIAQSVTPRVEYKAAAAWDGSTLVVTRSITELLHVTQTLSIAADTLQVINRFSVTDSAPVTLTYARR